MAVIGPTFADELRVAGLAGLPFSWGSDGVLEFDRSVTLADRQAILAVLAAHDPQRACADVVRDAFVDVQAKVDAVRKDGTVPKSVLTAIEAMEGCLKEVLRSLHRSVA